MRYLDPNVKFKSKRLKIITTTEMSYETEPYTMTEEILRKRAKQKNSGRFVTQLFCAIAVSLGSMCFGMVLGYAAAKFILGEDWKTVTARASLAQLGCAIGSLVFHPLSYKKGPRKLLLITSITKSFLWMIYNFPLEKLKNFVMFAIGFTAVSFNICGHDLLKDAVHGKNLIYLNMIFVASFPLGIILFYLSAFPMLKAAVIHPYTFAMGLSFLYFILLYFCPESPVFLYETAPVLAEDSLRFYRGPNHIFDDMRDIRRDAESKATDVSAKYMFFQKVVYKALIIIMGIQIFQSLTSYNLILIYSSFAWNSYDNQLNPNDRQLDCLFLASSILIFSLVGSAIPNKSGLKIKTILLISSICVTFSLFCILMNWVFIYTETKEQKKWLFLFFNILLIASYNSGYSECIRILISDYMPYQIYEWVLMISNFTRYMLNAIILSYHFSIQRYITTFSWLSIQLLTQIFGTFFIWLFVIESRGKSLLQIQMELGGNPVGRRSKYYYKYKQNLYQDV